MVPQHTVPKKCFAVPKEFYLANDRFAVLMIDVIDSRNYSIEHRQMLQETLAITLELINYIPSNELVEPIMFSAGDEIQGLFSDSYFAFRTYKLFLLTLGQNIVRGGIGLGCWTVRLPGLGTTAQDGEAFHHARDAIVAARQSSLNFHCFFNDSSTSFSRAFEKDLLKLQELSSSLQEKAYNEEIEELICACTNRDALEKAENLVFRLNSKRVALKANIFR